MTIALYARRKQWPLTGVTVRLRHSRIHAEDCAECETGQGMLDRIESEIALDGDLTEEQRLKALEIANKCPVHRTLTSEINIRSRLVEGRAAPRQRLPSSTIPRKTPRSRPPLRVGRRHARRG